MQPPTANSLAPGLSGAPQVVNETTPKPRPKTSDSLWISLFFDGTGNHLDSDEPFKRHSNIAKLYQIHPGNRIDGLYRFYYRGVGSRAEDCGPLAWLRDSSILGGAAGVGGQARIRHALNDLAQTFSEQSDRGQRRIALFGFSRGASLARHLCNLLVQQGIPNLSQPKHPWRVERDFQIVFLGLFDSVGSFGFSGNNLDIGYFLDIPAEVQQVVHLIAAHERRSTFDLQSIREQPDQALPPSRQEWMFPGMHSDVGGGYAPQDQGRDNTLARLPLRRMLEAARQFGVPFLNDQQILTNRKLRDDFELPDGLQNLYEDYCRRLHPEGDLQRELSHHECLYFRWLGTLAKDPAHFDVIAQVVDRQRQKLTEQAMRTDQQVQQLRRELLNRMRDEQRQMPSQLQGVALQAEVQRRLHASADVVAVLSARTSAREALESCVKSLQQLRSAFRDLLEQYRSALWRRTYLRGNIPDFDPPQTALISRQRNQLQPDDVIYRQRAEDVLVLRPLRQLDRDLLTWMDVAEPLPETMQQFFAQYVHDSVAHTPNPMGDHYFQRRSVFFRKSPPWRN